MPSQNLADKESKPPFLFAKKLQTLFRLLVHPREYPALMNILRSLLLGPPPSHAGTREKAIEWCRTNCISTEQALREVNVPAIFPDEKYPEIFSHSRRVVENCPQKMGGGGNTQLLYSLVLGIKATRVIETGVAYGWSSLSILLALRENSPEARLMSSNLHYPKFHGDERFVGCAVPEELHEQWTIIRNADNLALPEILSTMPACDLVHYDSAKSYEARMYAYPMLWNAIRDGGLLVSDDIDDNFGFKDFCSMVRGTPLIVETPQPSGITKYVGILRKPSSNP